MAARIILSDETQEEIDRLMSPEAQEKIGKMEIVDKVFSAFIKNQKYDLPIGVAKKLYHLSDTSWSSYRGCQAAKQNGS